jgi:hypothetical protein
MDEENEALAQTGQLADNVELQGEAILLSVLEAQGFLDIRVRQELANGKEYWRLERQLCHELMQQRSSTVPRMTRPKNSPIFRPLELVGSSNPGLASPCSVPR